MSSPASELPLTTESKATIAVVGTNDVDQQAYGRLLGDQFQLFYWALSELRENIARQCPDVVILDEKILESPDRNAVQSVLTEVHGKVVTLLATSQEDTRVGGDEDQSGLPSYVDGYLRPPADSMRLKIQNLLNVRHREQERGKQDDLERLFELSLDIMGVANLDGYFTLVNPAFGKILGYEEQELLNEPFLDFVHPDDREATLAEVARLSRGENVIHFQNRYRCKDGSYKWLAWTSYPTQDGKLYAVAREVTAQKEMHEELERRVLERTRAYVVLSECNQTLVRATDEHELLKDICEILIERGGYRLAWVGYAQSDEHKSVTPIAYGGHEEGYLQLLQLTWADTQKGQGPTGTAIRTGEVVIVEDIASDPHFEELRQEAVERDYHALMALPLKNEQGQPFGALNIYAGRKGVFDPKEVALLTELANDLAYGIVTLRAQQAFLKAAEALREREASFHLLFDNNPLPMWVYDSETLQFLEVNEAAIAHYGYTKEEFLSMTIADIRPPEDGAEPAAEGPSSLPDSHPARTWRHRLKDGRIIDVEISSHGLPFKGHTACLGVAQDVTEQRKLQSQLNHIQKMDAIGQFAGSIAHEFNNVLLGVQVHSEVMARAMGMDLEAPKKHEAAKPHLDELHGAIQKIVQILEIDMDPDKKLTDILTIFPQIKESIQLLRKELLQFKTDPKKPQDAITYLNELDQHTEEIAPIVESDRESLEKTNRIMPLFLQMSKAVHLLVQFFRKQEQITNSFTQIMASAQKGKSLTSPLLTFSHKQERTELETLNLNKIVREWEKTLRRLVGEDIHLIVDLSEELDNVLVDEGKMQQILMNLLSNARDAIHSRSPDDSSRPKTITIVTENAQLGENYTSTHAEVVPGPYVMLGVNDTGCGMDEATMARIFEPMFTTKAKGKGTGFGLAVVYGLVEDFGGSIYPYSEPGHGTVFKIYFPRYAGKDSVSEGLASRKTTEFLTGTETILVVEDEVGIRGAICDDLRTRGYHVLEARDVEHALQLSEEHRGDIDLALIDWVQPRMSGKSLSEKLCLLRPRLKTLFVSGYTQSALGSDIRPEIFLSKPFTTDALAKKLREMLDVPRKKRILLIEDEGVIAEVVAEALQETGYEVILAGDGASALTEHQQHNGQIDLVLADLGLPGNITGRDMIRQLLEQDPNLKIVACSGEGAVSIPGIMGTIAKPYSLDGLVEEVGIILPAEETAKE